MAPGQDSEYKREVRQRAREIWSQSERRNWKWAVYPLLIALGVGILVQFFFFPQKGFGALLGDAGIVSIAIGLVSALLHAAIVRYRVRFHEAPASLWRQQAEALESSGRRAVTAETQIASARPKIRLSLFHDERRHVVMHVTNLGAPADVRVQISVQSERRILNAPRHEAYAVVPVQGGQSTTVRVARSDNRAVELAHFGNAGKNCYWKWFIPYTEAGHADRAETEHPYVTGDFPKSGEPATITLFYRLICEPESDAGVPEGSVGLYPNGSSSVRPTSSVG